jgi:hypothetical protein
MRGSRLVATCVAVTAVLTAVGAAGASALPSSAPDPSVPATTATDVPSGSITATADDELSAEAVKAVQMEAEFAQCMRANGIASYPDPHVNDDGIIVVGIPFGHQGESAMDAAREACQSIFQPGGPPAEPGDTAGWEKIVPGGDCQCADGSEFAFWERRADPTKVVLYLDGGGACWTAEMCAFTGDGQSPFYNWSIHDGPPSDGGIFDVANPDNPLADYSVVYVPYCTGDVHLGDATRAYAPELTVEHKGAVNATTALTYLAEHYPDAAQVVVVGVSAGSVAAPVYGGLVADLLPDAQVTVLADSSGAYPDDPAVNTQIFSGQWGAFDTMPDWDVNEHLTAADWGPPRFWVQAGLHDPGIVLARFDFADDEVQTYFMELIGAATTDLAASIDANEATIEDAGVVQHSYTAPGHDHGVVSDNRFYTLEVNGVTLVDWVDALIAGEPLEDVR